MRSIYDKAMPNHGCTSLRYYGPSGWRCIECFEEYEVTPIEGDRRVS